MRHAQQTHDILRGKIKKRRVAPGDFLLKARPSTSTAGSGPRKTNRARPSTNLAPGAADPRASKGNTELREEVKSAGLRHKLGRGVSPQARSSLRAQRAQATTKTAFRLAGAGKGRALRSSSSAPLRARPRPTFPTGPKRAPAERKHTVGAPGSANLSRGLA